MVTLNDVCIRDYGKAYFADSVECLDLDRYETTLTGDNAATMDASVGIADWQSNRAVNSRHLLIELRFGYKSTANLDIRNMRAKVAHSRELLDSERISDKALFLFDTNVAPQAQSYFSRISKQSCDYRNWLAMDVESFGNYVVDSSSLPYQPENNLSAIDADFRNKYATGGLDSVEGLYKYWKERILQYKLRYNIAESKAIAETIIQFLLTLSFPKNSLENEFLSLMLEEVRGLLE